jgi:hypothetical protein
LLNKIRSGLRWVRGALSFTTRSTLQRIVRAVAYGLIGAAGALLLISPVFMADATPTAVLMSWFILVGGTSSALGTATDRWVGEFVGLPLLGPAFAVFGAITYRESHVAAPYLAAANLTLLLGLALLFMARWIYVLGVFHAADRLTRKNRRKT